MTRLSMFNIKRYFNQRERSEGFIYPKSVQKLEHDLQAHINPFSDIPYDHILQSLSGLICVYLRYSYCFKYLLWL